MDSGHTFNDTGPRLGNAPSNKSQSGIVIPLTQSLLGTIQWWTTYLVFFSSKTKMQQTRESRKILPLPSTFLVPNLFSSFHFALKCNRHRKQASSESKTWLFRGDHLSFQWFQIWIFGFVLLLSRSVYSVSDLLWYRKLALPSRWHLWRYEPPKYPSHEWWYHESPSQHPFIPSR